MVAFFNKLLDGFRGRAAIFYPGVRYGRFICRAWCYLGLVACYSVQVIAQFGQLDSENLENCRFALESIDMSLGSHIHQYVYAIDTDLVLFRDYYVDNSAYIKARLVNLESGVDAAASTLSSIHDKIEAYFGDDATEGRLYDVLVALRTMAATLTNGVVSVGITNVIDVAASGASSDLGIVTNIFVLQNSGVPVGELGLWWAWSSLGNFVSEYKDFMGLGTEDEAYDFLLTTSPIGLVLGMLSSALVPEDVGSWYLPTLADASLQYWFNNYGTHTFKYSIFDAYNTVGLGVLTNQFEVLLSALTNRDELASYFETGVDVYGTNVEYSLPEWQPTYIEHIDSYTNYTYYEGVAQRLASVFNAPTNEMFSLVDAVVPDSGSSGSSRFGFDLTFSGMDIGAGQQFGWTLPVWVPDTDVSVREFAQYFKSITRLLCYAVDLALLIVVFVRLHRAVVAKQEFDSYQPF